mmetsp:Transcript_13737/g.51278  ORF Transcript_13737/g.51278 Transcript_13737/m.51278 type:complete len:202 (+) Transcript_13737:1758-2363(+)
MRLQDHRRRHRLRRRTHALPRPAAHDRSTAERYHPHPPAARPGRHRRQDGDGRSPQHCTRDREADWNEHPDPVRRGNPGIKLHKGRAYSGCWRIRSGAAEGQARVRPGAAEPIRPGGGDDGRRGERCAGLVRGAMRHRGQRRDRCGEECRGHDPHIGRLERRVWRRGGIPEDLCPSLRLRELSAGRDDPHPPLPQYDHSLF